MDQTNLAKLNGLIDPLELLRLIGYAGSSPQSSNGYIRDFCPIHGGNQQRSLSINQASHLYKCHSCGEVGNLIDLFAKSVGIGFGEAIEKLSGLFDSKSKKTQIKDSRNPQYFWNQASEEGDHSYLGKKKIKSPPGIRFGKDQKGNSAIVVPFHDVEGKLQTLQYINEFGKFFLSGFRTEGSFFCIGKIKDGATIYVAEGLATAVTIWEALEEKNSVISVGSAGNLVKVFRKIREKYPEARVVFAVDDGKASFKELAKIETSYEFCVPSFVGLEIPKGRDPNDFNDLVSLCNQNHGVVRDQLMATQSNEPSDLFRKIGLILKDEKFSDELSRDSYDFLTRSEKSKFGVNFLLSGFPKLDYLSFSKPDFVMVQGMTNHGKTTFMLQLAYKFLSLEENFKVDPMCVFVTYESDPIQVRKKFLNIISNDLKEGIIFKSPYKGKRVDSRNEDFPKTIRFYNNVTGKNCRFHVLKATNLEKVEELIDAYQERFPGRNQVLFLDYLQIIEKEEENDDDSWKRIKSVSYRLESLARRKNIIIFVGSQVNDSRRPREGVDISNATTIILDVMNHSHESLRVCGNFVDLYKKKIGGKDVCSITVLKQKDGERRPPISLFFNGFHFQEVVESNLRISKGFSYEFAFD